MTQKQQPKPEPKLLHREWTFQSHNPGLHQVLLPGRKDQMGNLIEPPFEANFGGASGRDGLWRMKDKFKLIRGDGNEITGRELVDIMRTKMSMKPVADSNITELTQDKVHGDPVYEPEPEGVPVQ